MSPAEDRHDATIDAQALRAAAEGWDNRLQAAGIGAVALVAAVYPALLDALVSRFSLVTVASWLAVLGTISTAASAWRRAAIAATLARAAVTALAVAALQTTAMLPLLLVPACIYAALAWVFFASLGGECSLVERGARMIQPVAPPFIGPYCRRVTWMWGAVLLINAIVVGTLALFASLEAWRSAAGYGVWAWMGAISVVEFFVRKTYFRNYWYRGPFERLWSKLFPAEATEMGRRSAAYIRLVRDQLEASRENAPRD